MSDAGHSYLGASNMHRWSACPGSFELNKTAPPGKPGRAAVVGSLSHRLGEDMVKQLPMNLPLPDVSAWMDAWLQPVINTTTQMGGFDIECTPEIAESVKYWGIHCVERIRASSWHGLEMRLDLSKWFEGTCPPPVPLYGRADLIAYQASTRLLDVSDYKSGAGFVSEVDNVQALYYAAGAYFKAPGPVDRLRVNIVQPAFADRIVRSYEITAVDLLIWVDDVLRPAIERVSDPLAPLVPGDHCKWCPAAAICPELQAKATATAASQFKPVDMTDLELADALNTSRLLKLWIAAVEDFAVQRLNDGGHIPGWGMLPGQNRREWITGAEGPITEVFARQDLDPTDAYEPLSLRSPAQMEKFLKVSGCPQDVWQEIAQHIQLNPNKPRLGQVKNKGDEFEPIGG